MNLMMTLPRVLERMGSGKMVDMSVKVLVGVGWLRCQERAKQGSGNGGLTDIFIF